MALKYTTMNDVNKTGVEAEKKVVSPTRPDGTPKTQVEIDRERAAMDDQDEKGASSSSSSGAKHPPEDVPAEGNRGAGGSDVSHPSTAGSGVGVGSR